MVHDAGGAFVRPPTTFRCDAPRGFVREAGRYHLYIAHACPWCHRTAIARRWAGLEESVSVSFVDPLLLEGGWRFSPGHEDPLFGASFVHELYSRARPDYTGRVSVPVLWDRAEGTIRCNESAEILRVFGAAGGPPLYPEAHRAEIDAWTEAIYGAVNNGVYRCGFARTQAAYEAAFDELFGALDRVSAHLRDRAYLVGDSVTEADVRLFVTLVRFDAVYVGHFKCNRNRVSDDASLQRYLERLWAFPAFRETTNLAEIKLHYYGSHRALNPSGIVPRGPRLPWTAGPAAGG